MQYCLQPGCGVLVPRGRCPRHAARPNADVQRLYQTARWRRLRVQVLVESCYTCATCHRVEISLHVDHIVPVHNDVTRFWDRQNLQALCHACHNVKTVRGG